MHSYKHLGQFFWFMFTHKSDNHWTHTHTNIVWIWWVGDPKNTRNVKKKQIDDKLWAWKCEQEDYPGTALWCAGDGPKANAFVD